MPSGAKEWDLECPRGGQPERSHSPTIGTSQQAHLQPRHRELARATPKKGLVLPLLHLAASSQPFLDHAPSGTWIAALPAAPPAAPIAVLLRQRDTTDETILGTRNGVEQVVTICRRLKGIDVQDDLVAVRKQYIAHEAVNEHRDTRAVPGRHWRTCRGCGDKGPPELDEETPVLS